MDFRIKIRTGITRIGSVGGGYYELKPGEVKELARIADQLLTLDGDTSGAKTILENAITAASQNGADKKAAEKAELGYGRAN